MAALNISIGIEIDVQAALNQILEALSSINARRLMANSITAMLAGLKTELERRHLARLRIGFAGKPRAQPYSLVDTPIRRKGIGMGMEEFIADCIILMKSRYNNGKLTRTLRILKMRETNHTIKTHNTQ